jgi:DNA-directed RNA polymerase specialized sigma24 family protein
MEISSEMLTIIKEVVEKTAQESVQAVKLNNAEESRNYFRETEILLYNYPALRQKVESDEEFLYDPEAAAAPPVKSKDIVRFSGGGHGLDMDRYTEGIKSSMMRTRQEVLRIERALDAIKDDRYFNIIPMKYFDEVAIEEIAELFDCDVTTIRRNKNRLINRVKIMIFGTDALHTS